MQVRIEPTEDDPAWMLDKIEVTNTNGGYESQFYYGSWFNGEQKEDTLYRNNPLTEYKVRAARP